MDEFKQHFPNTNNVIQFVLKKKPMHRKFLMRSIGDLVDSELDEVEKYVNFLINENYTPDQIGLSYLTIVEDTFLEELRFRETGRYKYASFTEAQDTVYNNHEYMQRYMIGLALSSFWWANHTRIRRFYQQLLPDLAKRSGIYREVGPGHGMYFLESIRNCNFDVYEGIDISQTSVDMTKRIINSGFFGNFTKAQIILTDFLEKTDLALASSLVMGEVLEHVENPSMFLKQAYKTTTSDAIIYLTTCINAPAIDHIYNPGTIDNLEQLFADNGFSVKKRCIVPRDGTTLEECEKNKLAINVAYVLEKTK